MQVGLVPGCILIYIAYCVYMSATY